MKGKDISKSQLLVPLDEFDECVFYLLPTGFTWEIKDLLPEKTVQAKVQESNPEVIMGLNE